MAGAKAEGGEVNVRGIDHLVAQSIALKFAPALSVTDHVRTEGSSGITRVLLFDTAGPFSMSRQSPALTRHASSGGPAGVGS